MTENPIVGFIGAGRMATALAKGFVNAGLVSPDKLIASDLIPAGLDAFGKQLGCSTTDSNVEVLAKAKIIILAFKPHQLEEATGPLKDQFDESHLVISILAGVCLDKLDNPCGRRARVLPDKPNTPALVAERPSGYALGQAATEDDGVMVERLLSGVGVGCLV